MMKTLFGLLLAGSMTYWEAQAQAFNSPDILIDSKLDYNWSSVLISKFRTLLKNYNLTDPFSAHFALPIMLNEALVEQYLPQDSKDLIRDFGNAVGLNVLKAETKVWMHGFSYDVKGFRTDLKASEVKNDGLVIGTDFSASEVNLKADKISFSLVIPGKNNSTVFQVDILKPVIKATEENLIKFFAKIKVEDHKDFFKLQILKANFDQMAKGLMEKPQDIELNYEQIIIPEVSLKIGAKDVKFLPGKIEKFLRDKHGAIKGILLAQVAQSLQANTAEAAFKVLEQYKLNKEYWISSEIMKSQFQISNFSSSSTDNSLQVNLPADFCTNEKYKQLETKCIGNKVTQIAPTRLNKNLHSESVAGMKELMARGDANIVASISEDYLNKLLVTTYDVGLWKDTLDESGVVLGPNKVIMKLHKKGDTGTLVMDVVYQPTMIEKLLTGSRVIRIPLVLEVSLRIEKHDGNAVIIVRLNDVDTSDETLINGKPADNIVSTVKDVPRFKNKVAKAIRERLGKLRSKDILELRYPELNGLGLDKVDFLSDGHGRMNATMRLEELMEN